jgi:hypothetical protein
MQAFPKQLNVIGVTFPMTYHLPSSHLLFLYGTDPAMIK